MRSSLRLAAFACALAAAPAARAQPAGEAGSATVDLDTERDTELDTARREQDLAGVALYLDQDWLLDVYGIAGNQDRNYSMGLAIASSGAWIPDFVYLPLSGIDALIGIGYLRDRYASTALGGAERHTLVLGNTAFTPDRLNTPDVEEEDRPYASLLYLTVSRVTTSADQKFALTSELTVGALGLGIAEPVQKAIHEQLREMNDSETPYEPLGWSHQVSDGGEPTLGYRVAGARQVSDSTCNEFGHDLTIQAEASAGYYTNTAAGAMLRVGRIRTPFWAFTGNPLNTANEADQPCERSARDFEVFAWLAGRERFVIYNALLQGQFRDSDHTIDAGDVSRGVGEFDAGLSLGLWRGHLSFAYAGRSSEFNSDLSRAHTWGGLYVSYAHIQ